MLSVVATDLGAVLGRLSADMVARMPKAALVAVSYLGAEIGEFARDRLNKRGTGALARSFRSRITSRSTGEVAAASISDLPYAGIQERGGTIRARTRKNLAIPLNRAASKKWPRDWPKDALRFIPSKKAGVTGILAKQGKRRMLPQYVLKPQVYIPGTHYIRDAVRSGAPRAMIELQKVLFEKGSR